MLIKDVFKEVITGYNINNAAINDKYSKIYKTIQKDSIQYTNIINSKLIDKRFSGNIKPKYFLQNKDILIFVKKPYRVGIYKENNNDIIIPNNFIILRGLDQTKYNYIFITNYLEKIGISKYIENNNYINNLTVDDVKKINLPTISLENQNKISTLLNSINERSSIYTNILDNDDIIINYALNSVIGNNND